MKKLMCAIIALIIVMQSAAVFSAENKTAESAQSETESILKQSVILMPGEKYCFVNGEFKTVGDVAPVIESGRTLVPARFFV